MIIDLQRFVNSERPFWDELESILNYLENNPDKAIDLEKVKRFHYLYERTSADLAKIMTFASEPELRGRLEALVARAYGEIHETRGKQHRIAPLHWFLNTFPQTFRKHSRAFGLSVLITLVGCLFGVGATALDPEAKSVIMPFSHLQGSPSERVKHEESAVNDRLDGGKAAFSTQLMTHNTKVSIFALALGMTWGVGTMILLFCNGVILGAVVLDYIRDGQSVFLAGWLLPHGSVEIPAILIAGQAGLVLGQALVGWGRPVSLASRMRAVAPDLTTLIFGVGLLLVWAGFIEAFFSQYHEPVIPYAFKITFGMVELILLTVFLWKSGKKQEPTQARHAG